VTTRPAAIVLPILAAIFTAVFPTILAHIFSAVFAAVFTTRGLVRLTRHRGGRQQRARDENCTEQL